MVTQRRGLQPEQLDEIIDDWIGIGDRGLNEFSHSKLTEFFTRYCGLPVSHPGVSARDGVTKRDRLLMAVENATPHQQADVLEGLLKWSNRGLATPPPGRTPALEQRIRRWTLDLRGSSSRPAINAQPLPDIAKQAISDVELLSKDGRFDHAVDRLHTAFHAVLKRAARDIGREPGKKEGPEELWALVRRSHKAFRHLPENGPPAAAVSAVGKFLSALNNIRNQASLAHANDQLIAPEAARPVVLIGLGLLRALAECLDPAWDDAAISAPDTKPRQAPKRVKSRTPPAAVGLAGD